MRRLAPWLLICSIACLAGGTGAALGAPATTWAEFQTGNVSVGTPMTLPLSGGSSVDVTIQTGGTQGVGGFDFDTLGVTATGLGYSNLRVLTVFNGGGSSAVSTKLTFTNASVGPEHLRGLLLVGMLSTLSSDVAVTSSIAGRVESWTVVGSAFSPGPGNDGEISWDPVSGLFQTTSQDGNDSRCLAIDLGELRSDDTITVSLLQHLNDGVVFAFGEEVGATLDVPPGRDDAAKLAPPRPNPASASTSIEFSLPAASPVRIEAYDLAGRRLAVLAEGGFAAGTHAIRWGLTGDDGSPVAPGLVFLRLASADAVRTRRLLVVR